MKSTRSRLKETAFSLFAAYGYESTTMSQIANAIGIKKPTLYSYYESKEELFLSEHMVCISLLSTLKYRIIS
jgi:AcrR family transcriptional regulator